jgi:hypothetical protein
MVHFITMAIESKDAFLPSFPSSAFSSGRLCIA